MYLLDLEVTKGIPENKEIIKYIPYMNLPTINFHFFTVDNDRININFIDDKELIIFDEFEGFKTEYELKSLLYNTYLLKQELVKADKRYNDLMNEVGIGF